MSADPQAVMARLLLVAAGAAVGGATRYALTGVTQEVLGFRFPYGTLAVNVIGCCLIGAFMALAEMRLLAPHVRVLVVPGLLGGFTTFSAFAYETDAFLRDGQSGLALVNVAASVALGVFAVFVGRTVVRALGL